jgi:hypothetical protein
MWLSPKAIARTAFGGESLAFGQLEIASLSPGRDVFLDIDVTSLNLKRNAFSGVEIVSSNP